MVDDAVDGGRCSMWEGRCMLPRNASEGAGLEGCFGKSTVEGRASTLQSRNPSCLLSKSSLKAEEPLGAGSGRQGPHAA